MENYWYDTYVRGLVLDFFGRHGCTILEGTGTYMDQFEDSMVLEFITRDAVEGERMAQRFSRDFCDWYEQECTMITMDSVSMELCYGDA